MNCFIRGVLGKKEAFLYFLLLFYFLRFKGPFCHLTSYLYCHFLHLVDNALEVNRLRLSCTQNCFHNDCCYGKATWAMIWSTVIHFEDEMQNIKELEINHIEQMCLKYVSALWYIVKQGFMYSTGSSEYGWTICYCLCSFPSNLTTSYLFHHTTHSSFCLCLDSAALLLWWPQARSG